MLFVNNTRRRRSAAAFALVGWLMVLFVSIAHACVPSQSSHQTSFGEVAAGVFQHADSAHENAEHGKNACERFCDAQTSDVVKEKSFASSGVDQLVLFTYACFFPWTPSGAIIANPPATYSLLYDPNLSLRFNRLTL